MPQTGPLPESGDVASLLTFMFPAERHNDLNKCAWIRIPQPDLATKFFDSLSHTSDTQADAIRPELSNLLSNSLAIVTHGNG